MYSIGDKVYFIGREVNGLKNDKTYFILDIMTLSNNYHTYYLSDGVYTCPVSIMEHNLIGIDQMRLEKFQKIIECIK